MNKTAERLIDDYSSMEDEEQKEFDRRYRELHKFRRGLNQMVKDFKKKKQEERNAGTK